VSDPAIAPGDRVVIAGMHRSGTSLLAHIMVDMGAYVGSPSSQLPATAANPNGYGERWDVIRVNDELLAVNGCSWRNLAKWRTGPPGVPYRMTTTRLRAALEDLDGHRPWVLKDPRLCLTLPYWLDVAGSMLVVITHRCPLEIAESMRAAYGIPSDAGLELWERYLTSLLEATRGCERVFVNHADLIRRPDATLAALVRALRAAGATWIPETAGATAADLVDASLYRSRPARSDAARLSPRHIELAALLSGSSAPA
jgi:hypothetical protein